MPEVDSNCKIISWNIAGIRSKKDVPSWLNFKKQFDIIAFQETWDMDCSFWLDGYKSYFLPARPSLAGRAKGGLALLFSLKLKASTKRLEGRSHNCLMVELSILNHPKILLVNFYNSGECVFRNEHLFHLNLVLENYKSKQTNS